MAQEGARIAREIGDLGLASNHLSVRGYALSQLGRLVEARAAFDEGLDAARRIGAMQGVRGLLSGLSQLELDLGEIAEAERSAREGIEICRTTGEAEGELNALLDLSRAERAKGDVAAAKTLASEALEKARAVAIDSRIANAELELGEALWLEGDLPAARAALSESLRLRAGTAGARSAFVRVRLARVALAEGDAASARDAAKTAVAEAPESVEARQTLVEALVALSDSAARQELSTAEELAAKAGAFRDVLESDLWHGRVWTRLGSSGEARRALGGAERSASERGFALAALEARVGLARLDAAAHAPGSTARLERLEAEARARGCGLLARR